MKRIVIFIAVLVLALSAADCSQKQDVNQNDTEQTQVSDSAAQDSAVSPEDYDFGAKSALEKENLTVEEMLNYAIQDEYLARKEYELIMDEYGEQRPFSNIILAEENHIIWLKELFEAYGYTIPADNAIDYAVLPASLEEAFDAGVQAEVDNIAMYEKFMQSDLPDDVLSVFTELRDASQNHLASFEKGVRGNGQGQGNGNSQD